MTDTRDGALEPDVHCRCVQAGEYRYCKHCETLICDHTADWHFIHECPGPNSGPPPEAA